MVFCCIIAFLCTMSFFAFRFGWHFEMFGMFINLTPVFIAILLLTLFIVICTAKKCGRGLRITSYVLTILMVAANGIFFYMRGGDLGIYRRLFLDAIWMLVPVAAIIIAMNIPWRHFTRSAIPKGIFAAVVLLVVLGVRFNMVPIRMVTPPAVFVYGDYYTVVWVTNVNGVGWLEIDDERFYNTLYGKHHANTRIHQVRIPREQLNGAVYTANTRRLLFKSSNTVRFGRTISSENIVFEGYRGQDEIRILSLSDYHSMPRAAERVASHAGDFDILVLNGDLLSFIADAREVELSIMAPAGRITGGRIPIVFARGNHEMMSFGTSYLDMYIPLPQGRYYFTFTYGPLFGIVLDAGIDKPDEHPFHGGLSASGPYRTEQTRWLEALRDSAPFANYEHMIVISHIYLDTESETFIDTMRDWLHVMQAMPICMSIHGHTHRAQVREPNEHRTFPLIESGGKTDHVGFRHVGALITLGENNHVTFINDSGEIVGQEVLRMF